MDIIDRLLDLLLLPIDLYRWLVRESLALARDLFRDYGYLVVFLGTALENTLFLGLFIPGIFILILAGLSAENGLINLPLTFVVALAGTSIGDTISYAGGRFGWKRAVETTRSVPWMDTIRAALTHHPAIFVIAYHFMGYTRLVGPLTAGLLRVPFRRWWIFDLIGATLWVGVYVTVGYIFGRLGLSLDDESGNVRRLEWLFAVLAVIAVGGWLLLRRRTGRRHPPRILEALADDDPEDASPDPAGPHD